MRQRPGILSDRQQFVLVAVLFMLGSSIPPPATAAEGRIPIAQTTTIAAGEAGSYLVTQDFTGTISIGANHVTIDLDGHTITSPDGVSWIIKNLLNQTDLHILNGKLSGGARGINFSGISGNYTVEDVTITNSGEYGIYISGCGGMAARAYIKNVIVEGDLGGNTAFGGIGLSCLNGSRVEESQVRNCDNGIYFFSLRDSIIRNNVFTGNQGTGLYSDSSSSDMIVDNVVTRNGLGGIVLVSSENITLARNAVSENELEGIQLLVSNNNSIVQNNVSSNTQTGIFLWDANDNYLSLNTLARNGTVTSPGNGISLEESATGSDRNTLDRNQCNSSVGGSNATGWGIFFSPASDTNVYSYNRAQGNSGCGAPPCRYGGSTGSQINQNGLATNL